MNDVEGLSGREDVEPGLLVEPGLGICAPPEKQRARPHHVGDAGEELGGDAAAFPLRVYDEIFDPRGLLFVESS